MRAVVRIFAVTARPAVVGCNVGDSSDKPDPVASSSAALTVIPAEMPSIPQAAVAWQTPNPTGTMGQGDPLVAVLKNNSATSLSLRLSVLSTGLDQRVASIGFGTFVVPAHSSQVFGFPVIALPVQSVGSESEAELQVDVLGVGGAVLLHVPSTPIFYEFDGTYATATMWGSGGKDVALGGTPPTDPTALIQSVLTSANAAFTLQGRVWNGTAFVDVTRLPIVGSATSLRLLGTYLLAGPRAQGFLGYEISHADPYPPPQPVGQFPYTICAQLSAELIDAGYGEPRMDGTGKQAVSASYAHFALYTKNGSASNSNSYYGLNGCLTTWLSPGDYFVEVSSFHDSYGTVSVSSLQTIATPTGTIPVGVGLLQAIHISGPQSMPVTLLPFAETDATRTAAIVSTLLTSEDLGLPQGQAPYPRITIDCTTPCGGIRSARSEASRMTPDSRCSGEFCAGVLRVASIASAGPRSSLKCLVLTERQTMSVSVSCGH